MAQEVAYTIPTPTGLQWGLPAGNTMDQSSRGANITAAIPDAESSAQQLEHEETDLQQLGYNVWIFNNAISSTLYVGQLQAGENDLQNTFTRNVIPPAPCPYPPQKKIKKN